MKKLLCAMCIALYATTAAAGPVIDFYLGGVASVGKGATFAGGSDIGDAIKSANSYGAVAGIDIPVFRVEAEYNFMTTSAVNMHAAMVNGYLKLLSTPVVKPYVGLGVGTVFSGDVNGGEMKKSFGGQGMVGLQFGVPMLPLFVDLEGRAFYANNIYTMPAPIDKNVGFLQYDVRAKLRYVF